MVKYDPEDDREDYKREDWERAYDRHPYNAVVPCDACGQPMKLVAYDPGHGPTYSSGGQPPCEEWECENDDCTGE